LKIKNGTPLTPALRARSLRSTASRSTSKRDKRQRPASDRASPMSEARLVGENCALEKVGAEKAFSDFVFASLLRAVNHQPVRIHRVRLPRDGSKAKSMPTSPTFATRE
jgi:hypothetical protein